MQNFYLLRHPITQKQIQDHSQYSILCQNRIQGRIRTKLLLGTYSLINRYNSRELSQYLLLLYENSLQTDIYHDFNPSIRASNATVTLYEHFSITAPVQFHKTSPAALTSITLCKDERFCAISRGLTWLVLRRLPQPVLG